MKTKFIFASIINTKKNIFYKLSRYFNFFLQNQIL